LALFVHVLAALLAIAIGAAQLAGRKGTRQHKFVGWTWMAAMVVVAVSSFWLQGFMDIIWGFGLIHLLSLWILVCVAVAIPSARVGNLRIHKGFTVGAYCGVVGAGVGAFMPGRMLNQALFGG
jgi:uncharacterized membrane protein